MKKKLTSVALLATISFSLNSTVVPCGHQHMERCLTGDLDERKSVKVFDTTSTMLMGIREILNLTFRL